ncbi:MAG: hypothetical protein ACO3E0_01150 [Candidatus Kapaibacteriota bacterium]|jgi:hypothetical protein
MNMRMKSTPVLLTFVLLALVAGTASAQRNLGGTELSAKRDAAMQALTTIDENLVSYFPRWKLCEPDIAVKLKHVFTINERRPANLNGEIRITAAPKSVDEMDKPYDILLIQWGSFHEGANADLAPGQAPDYVTLNAQDIRTRVPERLVNLISGQADAQGYDLDVPARSYCFYPIDPKEMPTQEEVNEMVNFFQPTTKTHAMSISAFEQALKLGQGPGQVWLLSELGTDMVGMPFWTSGEGRVSLRINPIGNKNPNNNRALPSILSLRLGMAYRITGGIEGDNQILDFIAPRLLDAGPGGKAVAGFDFNVPTMEEFGLSFHAELPLQGLGEGTEISNLETYVPYNTLVTDVPPTGRYADSTIYLLRGTGRVSLFYNWWPDRANPDNFFRIDLGMVYSEVQQTALWQRTPGVNTFSLISDARGIQLYHPTEALDWVYAKIEYFNQAGRPFGVSAQIANQILMGRVFVPIVGQWLYLEAKYATNLRTELRPFDFNSFFMISPVIRFSI